MLDSRRKKMETVKICIHSKNRCKKPQEQLKEANKTSTLDDHVDLAGEEGTITTGAGTGVSLTLESSPVWSTPVSMASSPWSSFSSVAGSIAGPAGTDNCRVGGRSLCSLRRRFNYQGPQGKDRRTWRPMQWRHVTCITHDQYTQCVWCHF